MEGGQELPFFPPSWPPSNSAPPLARWDDSGTFPWTVFSKKNVTKDIRKRGVLANHQTKESSTTTDEGAIPG